MPLPRAPPASPEEAESERPRQTPSHRSYLYGPLRQLQGSMIASENEGLSGATAPPPLPVCRLRPRLSRRSSGGHSRAFSRVVSENVGEEAAASPRNTGEEAVGNTIEYTVQQAEASFDDNSPVADSALEDGTGANDDAREEQPATSTGTSGDGQESTNNRTCGICLETSEEESTFWCPHCTAPWCITCITRWSSTSPSPSCPNCRQELSCLRNSDRSSEGDTRGLPRNRSRRPPSYHSRPPWRPDYTLPPSLGEPPYSATHEDFTHPASRRSRSRYPPSGSDSLPLHLPLPGFSPYSPRINAFTYCPRHLEQRSLYDMQRRELKCPDCVYEERQRRFALRRPLSGLRQPPTGLSDPYSGFGAPVPGVGGPYSGFGAPYAGPSNSPVPFEPSPPSF